jgi:hypothetical protein
MILASIRQLAKTLGVREDQAEDVLHSEKSARAAISRRGLFKAAGAVAAGTLFSQYVNPLDGYEFRIGAYGNIACASPRALTTFDALLKEIYSQDIVYKALTAPSPLLAMLQKESP